LDLSFPYTKSENKKTRGPAVGRRAMLARLYGRFLLALSRLR
jgi:hypothetical protein